MTDSVNCQGAKGQVANWLRRVGILAKKSYALDALDLKLRKYIRQRGGFFVEAGANDGISQSNTLHFERYFGWSGLLIEPIPELATRASVNRPGCRVEQSALVPIGREGEAVPMTYCNLMSIVEGARGSPSADDEHLSAGKTFLVEGDHPRSVEVKGDSLSAILDRHGVERIDLLSLDVEGFEAQALDGIDFSRHFPTWIIIEANNEREIDERLLGRYDKIDKLSHHDVLYRAKG